MTSAEQGDEQLVERVTMADDYLSNRIANQSDRVGGLVDLAMCRRDRIIYAVAIARTRSEPSTRWQSTCRMAAAIKPFSRPSKGTSHLN